MPTATTTTRKDLTGRAIIRLGSPDEPKKDQRFMEAIVHNEIGPPYCRFWKCQVSDKMLSIYEQNIWPI